MTAKTHLTRKEASDFTGFSVATLAKWATVERGPRFVKLGDSRSARVRYPLSELEAFLRGKPTVELDRLEGTV
jgi:hypothetical protein